MPSLSDLKAALADETKDLRLNLDAVPVQHYDGLAA